MSHPSGAVDEQFAELSFPDLLTALDSLGVTFRRRGADLALKGGSILTAELLQAVAEHKPTLLQLCDCRAELTRLHEYVIRLRCENPPRGTRDQAFAYLRSQTDKLKGWSLGIGGTVDGWPDPADAFADMDQITGLREALIELMRPDAPYPVPLPPGCVLLPEANFDVFAAGRLYNGKLIAPRTGLMSDGLMSDGLMSDEHVRKTNLEGANFENTDFEKEWEML